MCSGSYTDYTEAAESLLAETATIPDVGWIQVIRDVRPLSMWACGEDQDGVARSSARRH